MSAIGTDIKNGAQLAIEQLSGPLAKMGFKVELAPFDDQGNPDTGVANAKSIVADPAILAVVGHYNSGVQIPSSEEYHAAGLVNVSPANTNPKVTDRGYAEVNRICGRDDVQGAVGAQFAKTKGIKSAYVLHDKTAYGQGIAEYFKQRGREARASRCSASPAPRRRPTSTPSSRPSSPPSPRCIYFGGMFDQAAVLFKQARQKGYKGMFLSDDGFDSSDAAKIGGDALLAGRRHLLLHRLRPGRASIPAPPSSSPTSRPSSAPSPSPSPPSPTTAPPSLLKAIENAAKAAGGKLPARADVRQGRARPQGLPGHHRHHHLQRQGRPRPRPSTSSSRSPPPIPPSGPPTRSTRPWTSPRRSDERTASRRSTARPALAQTGAGSFRSETPMRKFMGIGQTLREILLPLGRMAIFVVGRGRPLLGAHDRPRPPLQGLRGRQAPPRAPRASTSSPTPSSTCPRSSSTA